LVDQKGKRVDHWKLANDPKVILATLAHFPQIEVNEGQNSVIFFGKA